MELKDFTLPYWLDEATSIRYAKDCAACGGSSESYHEAEGKSVSGTCDTCHGSGVVPTDECPAWIAGLILADNQRRVFEADKDWVVGLDDDEEEKDYEDDEDEEDDENDEGYGMCSGCGYPLDSSGECTGNGCGLEEGFDPRDYE